MPGEDAVMSQPDPDITDLANIIRDLRREVVALQQDNKELQDELARAARAPATPAMATTTTTTEPTTAVPVAPLTHTETRQPKMALPDAFNGSRSNLKRFGTQCLLYMAVPQQRLPGRPLSNCLCAVPYERWYCRTLGDMYDQDPYSCAHVGTIQLGPSRHVW